MMTETTLSITGTNGFIVVVGLTKGSGTFRYIIGTKEQAKQLGEQMKKQEADMLFRLNTKDKLYVDIKPVNLKKCDISYCNHLCESNERYCLKCEDLMFEAQMELKAERDREYNEDKYEVCYNENI